ncbi:MAG: transglycosylase, partial [Methylobacter sp.]
MNKPAAPHTQEIDNAKAVPKRKPGPRSPRPAARKTAKAAPPPLAGSFRRKLLLISLEVLGLVITAVSTIMFLLGYSANWFSGTSFFGSLLPFAIGVLGIILVVAGFLIGWWKLRKWLQDGALIWLPVMSVSL